MIKVSILCTEPSHPVNSHLTEWATREAGRASVQVLRDRNELVGGDYLFLVSCQQIVDAPRRQRFRHSLVVHASPLPVGRGMSPHVWRILEGASDLVVCLLNAEDAVDSGDIWTSLRFPLSGTELHDEINALLFRAETTLLSWALDHCDSSRPTQQQGEPTYYRRRTPSDSRIDPARPLAEAFDLLRIADPIRYPAFFEHRGKRFRLRLERMEEP